MAAPSLVLFAPDESATRAIGVALAGLVGPGDVLLLSGDLGSGKSSLARALIRELMGAPDLDVPSPSFALVQPYAAPGFPILHADLYRLVDAVELGELGLLDDPEALVIVEWPERAPLLGAEATLLVHFTVPPGGLGRRLAIHPVDPLRDLAALGRPEWSPHR